MIFTFPLSTRPWSGKTPKKVPILAIFPNTGSKGPVQKKMRFFDFFQSPSVGPKMLSKVCGKSRFIQSRFKWSRLLSGVSRESKYLLQVLKTSPHTLDNILGPTEGFWKKTENLIFFCTGPLLPVVGKMAKISTFWGVLPLHGRVESREVHIISKHC